MTKGDSVSCKCPACKQSIWQPAHQQRVLRIDSTIQEGTVICPHCKTKLYFWSGMTTYVNLEIESKVK